MTALQGWLSYRPMQPRTLKVLICDALRVRPAGQDTAPPAGGAVPAGPALLRPGLERC
ncbi:hypothetical protein [Mycolicibacterium sp. GF69]|uniref:hypothetical protein n=1 Tax=Mycolicibacterium sp. GF69 TaxID=2267251 RepID=UPI001403B85A|nr:hypothetical protein [Mycolicibacterium sp. GF69]